MRNASLGEAQAIYKVARRNINNPRYADDTTLMAESTASYFMPFFPCPRSGVSQLPPAFCCVAKGTTQSRGACSETVAGYPMADFTLLTCSAGDKQEPGPLFLLEADLMTCVCVHFFIS